SFHVGPVPYTETVSATETYQETDTGNADSGDLVRDGHGGGTYTKTFTPQGGPTVSTSGSLNDTFHEAGNGTAGGVSETFSGTNRYTLLDTFPSGANGGGNGTGNVDLTPWGPGYTQRDPQSVWQKTGAANTPAAAAEANGSAVTALGQALDSGRFQSGYLN